MFDKPTFFRFFWETFPLKLLWKKEPKMPFPTFPVCPIEATRFELATSTSLM